MARILPATYYVDFSVIDEKDKTKIQEEWNEFGALISMLWSGDDAMSIETYIQQEREKITDLELSIAELVDVALGANYAQGVDLNVDMHSIELDDVAPHSKP